MIVSMEEGQEELIEGIEFATQHSTIDVLVPDIAAEAKVTVSLIKEGEVLVEHSQAWQPQRRWKAFVIKSSHEDLGYENYISKKQREIAEFIDLGAEQSSPKSVANSIGTNGLLGSDFHYNLETIVFERNYI